MQSIAESIYKKYEGGSKDPVNTWSLKDASIAAIPYVNKRESTIEYFGKNSE